MYKIYFHTSAVPLTSVLERGKHIKNVRTLLKLPLYPLFLSFVLIGKTKITSLYYSRLESHQNLYLWALQYSYGKKRKTTTEHVRSNL